MCLFFHCSHPNVHHTGLRTLSQCIPHQSAHILPMYTIWSAGIAPMYTICGACSLPMYTANVGLSVPHRRRPIMQHLNRPPTQCTPIGVVGCPSVHHSLELRPPSHSTSQRTELIYLSHGYSKSSLKHGLNQLRGLPIALSKQISYQLINEGPQHRAGNQAEGTVVCFLYVPDAGSTKGRPQPQRQDDSLTLAF